MIVILYNNFLTVFKKNDDSILLFKSKINNSYDRNTIIKMLIAIFNHYFLDVYVSSAGADTDTCGTEAAPCASLAVAVPKLASAGDKVIISGAITGIFGHLSSFPILEI